VKVISTKSMRSKQRAIRRRYCPSTRRCFECWNPVDCLPCTNGLWRTSTIRRIRITRNWRLIFWWACSKAYTFLLQHFAFHWYLTRIAVRQLDKLLTSLQSGPKESKLLHLSKSSLRIDQFLRFLPVDSVRNLLLRGMHITFIMSLHYLVKYKYLKTYNIYRWTEGPVVNFCILT